MWPRHTLILEWWLSYKNGGTKYRHRWIRRNVCISRNVNHMLSRGNLLILLAFVSEFGSISSKLQFYNLICNGVFLS